MNEAPPPKLFTLFTLLTLLTMVTLLPNRMNFQKNSKGPLTPPPHFRKIILQICYDRYGCIYARRYDDQTVSNACT